MKKLILNDFIFTDLFHSEGLNRLDQFFLNYLNEQNADLHQQLLTYRNATTTLSALQISELLITCAPVLENFLAQLFQIEEALAISMAKTTSFNPISVFKKYFVLRRAKKELNHAARFPDFATLDIWLSTALQKAALTTNDRELAIALLASEYLANPDAYTFEIEQLVAWCVQALSSNEGKQVVSGWTSFHIPERLDYTNLVANVCDTHHLEKLESPAAALRLRDGFALTDPRMTAREVQDEVNYCIYCHDHDGDFCSKGFPVKKGDPSQGFKKNPLDVLLTGCPLEEKISEMNYLKKNGHTLAALAVTMIDNPMCPATGHRICNDCMKACIYQKQEPVNIPQIETRVLIDVLDLPWGVEIYDLLTRWNPLRPKQWVMKPYNGLKVMVAGMGPAGFTIAHHLLLEGFAVVGFDGLKIEPLSETLLTQPIYHFNDLKESLDERVMAGFGGVAEYGITVRWDKNFLKLIYISLMRRPYFQVFGSVRLGGTITIDDAWKMGFDHFVLAVGAGLPKALPIPGSMATGMRQANDFLMAMQLGNAAKASSLTNLQVRMPAVVIGGGLTGVDTATELQAYYIAQVEKTLYRYQILVQEYSEDYIHAQLDSASYEILMEFLQHGLAVIKERERAASHKQRPNFIRLIREWGGVTIVYRRSMQESPAYLNNHDELKKALEEGVYYLEGLEPIAVDLNKFNHVETLVCHKRIRDKETSEWISTTETVRLPARSILVATGTQPNTAYEFEHRGTFNRLNLQYQHYEDIAGTLNIAHGVQHCKDTQFGPFTSYHHGDYRVSLIGDTHPVFHGSVVKAIASGMRTYPKIVELLKNKIQTQADENEYHQFATRIQDLLQAKVISVVRKTDVVLELTIRAPLAARHYQAGQFYRLQNFEFYAPRLHHTSFQMEPLILQTADCDVANGLLTFLVQENTTAAKLCRVLKPGEPVALMGPTGVRAKVPAEHETVLIIGNTASFAFLRSYGKTLRQAGNHVIYLCEFEDPQEIYCQSEIEQAADTILWVSREGLSLPAIREQDYLLTANDSIAALELYARSKSTTYKLIDVDRMYVIGGIALLQRFQLARKDLIKQHFIKDPKIFASVYGNMQCMLKGVCAQCLQWQIDPETGQRTKAVFACSWQDQPLEIIDIEHMESRRMQNYLQEQLSNLWVDHLFAKHVIN